MESSVPGRKACVGLLKACGKSKDLCKGARVHADVLKCGFLEQSCYVASTLVSMYAKCGAFSKAKGLLNELPIRDVFSWSALIAGYTQHGKAEEALDCFEQMQHEGLSPDQVTFASILKACGSLGEAEKGKKIHDEIVQRDLLGDDVVLGTALIDMYVKCGALSKAQQVLDELVVRDVVAWNALMTGYANQKQNEDALKCFEQMQHEGICPDEIAFICIMKTCSNLEAIEQGKKVHDQIASLGLLGNSLALDCALIDMYISCGALEKARQVLQELPVSHLVSWNALIAEYTRQLQYEDALSCFEWMQCRGPSPNSVTFTYILKACGSIGAADKGERIHHEIARHGLLENNAILGNTLVDMYARCGLLEKARRVLGDLLVQNVVTWNALITGYSQQGQGEEALSCFELMKSKGIIPDKVTFTCILNACGCVGEIGKGEQIHREISENGLLAKDIVLGNALVDMYAKCGKLKKGRQVLEGLPVRDVVSWNSLIAGYAQNEQAEEALKCLELMQHEGLCPDEVTFVCILKACGSIGAADKGEEMHDVITIQGILKRNLSVGTALVDMYAKCGALVKARQVLEELPAGSVVPWNALLAGFVEKGQIEDALDCYEQLQQKGISPNEATFNYILQACALLGAVDKGDELYGEIAKRGLLDSDIVLGTALVDMYARCGAFASAKRVLEKLPKGNVASWNALIAGYAQCGQGQEALHCFEKLQLQALSPDEVTFTCVLKACGSIEATEKGEQIHDQIAKRGLLENNVVLGTALVDMYARCGALVKAQALLEELKIECVVSWSALIARYAQRGYGQEALNCFEQMQSKGLSPDIVTFSSILNACSHSGLVEEGELYFTNMSTRYGLTPDLEHYTCMVDLFGRAGHFDKAVAMIQRMPSTNHPAVWSSLLGACQKWGEVNIGRWAFDHAIQVDKSDAAPYVCLVNIFKAAGMHEDARIIEAMRLENKAWKKPGCSWWIEISGVVHKFSGDDKEHAQIKIIHEKLQDIDLKIKREGNLRSHNGVSINVSDESLLCGHSEKLAIACALINTPQEETVRIVKNTSMCEDCHIAVSVLSRVEKRKIVIRDTKRSHIFEDGKCLCRECDKGISNFKAMLNRATTHMDEAKVQVCNLQILATACA